MVAGDVLDHLLGLVAGRVKVIRQGIQQLAILPVEGLALAEQRQHIGKSASAAFQHGERSLEAAVIGAVEIVQAQVPLARHVGVVTGVPEQLGKRRHAKIQVALVARVAKLVAIWLLSFKVLKHIAQAGNMAVRAGQQHGAGGGAVRRDMEVRQQDALPGQRVNDRRFDLAAENPQIVEPHIVHHDQQHIGPLGRRRAVRAGTAGQNRQGRRQQTKQPAPHPFRHRTRHRLPPTQKSS